MCSFLQFVPLEDEILDFFRPVALNILQLLRARPCLPTQGNSNFLCTFYMLCIFVNFLLLLLLLTPSVMPIITHARNLAHVNFKRFLFGFIFVSVYNSTTHLPVCPPARHMNVRSAASSTHTRLPSHPPAYMSDSCLCHTCSSVNPPVLSLYT